MDPKEKQEENAEISKDAATVTALTPVDSEKIEPSRDYAGASAKSSPAEIALVRKLDLRIIPTLFVMHFLNYIDRNTIAQAKLNRFEKELGMEGTDFNTAVSILVVGYVLFQVPSNMLITKIRPSIYMSAWMMIWAVVSGCTALVQNYGSLIACRFFLGITESPFYPGALYVLSTFYTRKEIASRIALLYLAQIVATGFSSLIAAGVFSGLDHVRGLSGWRWLFALEGAVTFLVAIAGLWLLPDTPRTTRWLSPAERELAHSRMQRDNVEDMNEEVSAMEGLKQAARDYKTWIFVFMQMFHYSALAFNNFFPTVIQTLGYSTTITLVLACPPLLAAGFFDVVLGWSSGRFHERTWHITAGLLFAIIGFIIAPATMNTAGRYIACFVFAIGTYSVNSVIVGWASATLSRTKEKKAVVLAMVNIGGQIGYIYGPYFWPNSDAPLYVKGFSLSASFALMSIGCAWLMRICLKRENRRLREQAGDEDINTYGY